MGRGFWMWRAWGSCVTPRGAVEIVGGRGLHFKARSEWRWMFGFLEQVCPQGTWAMSGDICGCHTGGAADTARVGDPEVPRTAPQGMTRSHVSLVEWRRWLSVLGPGWVGAQGRSGADQSLARSCTTRPRASASAPCGRAVRRPTSKRASQRCTRTCGATVRPPRPTASPCSREAGAGGGAGPPTLGGCLPPPLTLQERPSQTQRLHHGQVALGLRGLH